MASQIDPTQPADGVPAVKSDLRTNLQAAKDEIEALQTGKTDLGHQHVLADLSDAGALAGKNVVATGDVADAAITQSKLAAAAVDASKLADDAVVTAKLADAQVTGAKLAGAAVGTAALADDAVTTAKIAAAQVTTGKLAAGAVGTTQLADDAVTTAKLGHGTAGTLLGFDAGGAPGEIAAGANVTIAAGSIAVATPTDLTDLADTPSSYASQGGRFLRANAGETAVEFARVPTAGIEDGAVTNAKLGADAVSQTKIAADAVVTAKIANSAVTAAKIAADAVTATKIPDGSISAAKIATNAVTASALAAGAVGTSELAANAVTTAKIADAQVTQAKIATAAVGASQLQDDAVVTAKLAHGTPDRLLGYGATGDPIEITPGAGIAISGGTVSATATTGALAIATDYGAVADGTSTPVSEWLAGGARDRGYANLAAIQADYPHVDTLTDQIDWAAVQACADSGMEVYLPAGSYVFNRPVKTAHHPQSIGSAGTFGLIIRGAGIWRTNITRLDTAAPDLTTEANWPGQAAFAIHGSNNFLRDMSFTDCRSAIFIGQDPDVSTPTFNDHAVTDFNVLAHLRMRDCGIAIHAVSEQACYYNEVHDVHAIQCQIGAWLTNGAWIEGVWGVPNCNRNTLLKVRAAKCWLGFWLEQADTCKLISCDVETCKGASGPGSAPDNNRYSLPSVMPAGLTVATGYVIAGNANMLHASVSEQCDHVLHTDDQELQVNGCYLSEHYEPAKYSGVPPRFWQTVGSFVDWSIRYIQAENADLFPDVTAYKVFLDSPLAIDQGGTGRTTNGRPLTPVSGDMSAKDADEQYSLTGAVSDVPVTNGWFATLYNKTGSDITGNAPASGDCILVDSGTTASTFKVKDNKSVFVSGDGTDLWVRGDQS